MKKQPGIALWGAAILAVILFIAQTVLADGDAVALRFMLNGAAIGGLAWVVTARTRRGWRAVHGPPPEPISLVLAGLAVLSVWLVAWWLMEVTNYGLDETAGNLSLPSVSLANPDRFESLFGVDIAAATYELEVLFAVVLIPLVQAWLWWGLIQPELGTWVGRWRAAWIAGGLFGVFTALIAVQDLKPALPWGLASVSGYVLVGCVAALVVYLTGSPWAGFAAHATFAYGSLAWQNDRWFQELLVRERFSGFFDLTWLTIIVLGGFGAAVAFQMMRFRNPRPPDPDRSPGSMVIGLGLPLMLILAALVVLAVMDIGARS